MRRFVAFGPAFVVLLTAVVVLALAPAVVSRVSYRAAVARVTVARQVIEQDDILERINAATRAVAESVEPSVVHIDVRMRDRENERMRLTSGSGWVYDREGHVVTNEHVVDGADAIQVQLYDGRVYDAAVAGMDAPTDIAVLRLSSATGLIPIARDSDGTPHQGDTIFAFGSPLGFKFSMSKGIISGLGRAPSGTTEYGGFTNFIQTDAAVNPGNSGGPLVNTRGRLIGMNVAIANASGSGMEADGDSAGISFAITLPTIESVVEQLIRRGTVSRGFLGIRWNGRQHSFDFGESISSYGIQVTDVVQDGPADRAGIEPGDILLSVDGQRITSSEVLRAVVSSAMPGQQLDVGLWRDGSERDVAVTLAEMPVDVLATTPSQINQMQIRSGMAIGQRSARGDNIDPVVAFVYGDSPAALAGFEADDLIVRVGSQEVGSANDVFVQFYVQDLLGGSPVDVTVQRSSAEAGSRTYTLTLDLED